MAQEGHTPIEILSVLNLDDYDLPVRCLEVIRSHAASILPEGMRYRLEVIALCHHHPSNIYPALGLFGLERDVDVLIAEDRINSWVRDHGIDWLVAESRFVNAPSWESLKQKGQASEPDSDDGSL